MKVEGSSLCAFQALTTQVSTPKAGTQTCSLCGQRSFTPLSSKPWTECPLTAQARCLCSVDVDLTPYSCSYSYSYSWLMLALSNHSRDRQSLFTTGMFPNRSD